MRWHDVLFNEHTTEMLRVGVDIIKTTGTLERYVFCTNSSQIHV